MFGQATGQVQSSGCRHRVDGSGQLTLCVTVAPTSVVVAPTVTPAPVAPVAAGLSRPLRQVATGARIVDQIAPGTIGVRK